MSRKLSKTNRKGFTLIEVVLVLAIGGLIFLLAFIAFRNASTNRRDGQRRAEASRFVAEMDNYLGDQGSVSPPSAANVKANFVDKYIANPWLGPTGNPYVIRLTAGTLLKPAGSNDSEYRYTPGPGTGCVSGSTMGPRDFKIEIELEKGTACRDSL